MTSTAPGLDLDAARREGAYPDGIPVTQGGQEFLLPAELPLEVFDPFLSDDFDLVGLVTNVLSDHGGKDDDGIVEIILGVLQQRPRVLTESLGAVKQSLELLFGEADFARFQSTRPGLATYARLISGLVRLYGVSLGEVSASLASSESDGATPKLTSPSTADSTSELSGETPEPTAS